MVVSYQSTEMIALSGGVALPLVLGRVMGPMDFLGGRLRAGLRWGTFLAIHSGWLVALGFLINGFVV